MKTKKLVVVAALTLMLVIPATGSLAQEWQEVVQNIGANGSINWSQGYRGAP